MELMPNQIIHPRDRGWTYFSAGDRRAGSTTAGAAFVAKSTKPGERWLLVAPSKPILRTMLSAISDFTANPRTPVINGFGECAMDGVKYDCKTERQLEAVRGHTYHGVWVDEPEPTNWSDTEALITPAITGRALVTASMPYVRTF